MLGIMLCCEDNGLRHDLVRAYAWSNLAAAQGRADAIKFRDKIEVRLTPPQLIEGQYLASNWKNGDTLDTMSILSSTTTAQGDRVPSVPESN